MIEYFSIRTEKSLVYKDVVCIYMDTNYRSYRLEFNIDGLCNENLDDFKKEICRMIDYVCTYDKEEQQKSEREAITIHLGCELCGKIKDSE